MMDILTMFQLSLPQEEGILACDLFEFCITERTLNPTLAKSSIHLLTSHFNHLPVIFVSGSECITIGIDFKETIMKTAIPLNKFPPSSCPTKSTLW